MTGASHCRSSDSTWATSVVPTSAPSITASAGAVSTRPRPANEATTKAVAVLLCRTPVTPMPASSAAKRLLSETRSRWRNSAPNARCTPVRTMRMPHSSSATAPSSSIRMSCAVGSCISSFAAPPARSRSETHAGALRSSVKAPPASAAAGSADVESASRLSVVSRCRLAGNLRRPRTRRQRPRCEASSDQRCVPSGIGASMWLPARPADRRSGLSESRPRSSLAARTRQSAKPDVYEAFGASCSELPSVNIGERRSTTRALPVLLLAPSGLITLTLPAIWPPRSSSSWA